MTWSLSPALTSSPSLLSHSYLITTCYFLFHLKNKFFKYLKEYCLLTLLPSNTGPYCPSPVRTFLKSSLDSLCLIFALMLSWAHSSYKHVVSNTCKPQLNEWTNQLQPYVCAGPSFTFLKLSVSVLFTYRSSDPQSRGGWSIGYANPQFVFFLSQFSVSSSPLNRIYFNIFLPS